MFEEIFARSPNVNKLSINEIDGLIKSDVDRSYGIGGALLSNASVNINTINYILDNLNAYQCFNVFNNILFAKFANNKIISACLKTNNKYIKQYIPYFLIESNLDKYNLREFYKIYKATPILFSREELLTHIINTDPNALYYFFLDPSQDELSDEIFDTIHYVTKYNWCLYKNPKLSKNQIQRAIDNITDIYQKSSFYLASYQELSVSQIQNLIKQSNLNVVLESLARNPLIPEIYIDIILDRPESWCNSILSSNKALSNNQIQTLIDERPDLHEKLANNESLSEIQMNFLLEYNHNKNLKIRNKLCCNPSLPNYMIQSFIDENDSNVDRWLCMNTSLTKQQAQTIIGRSEFSDIMFQDSNGSVVLDVQGDLNPNTSFDRALTIIDRKPSAIKKLIPKFNIKDKI